MKIVAMIFLLISCCKLTLVNADSVSNTVSGSSIRFYVKNETNMDFARVIVQLTKDGTNIYQGDLLCAAKAKKCKFDMIPQQIIKNKITLVFLQSNGKIVSAYILASHKIGQSNIVIPSDYYLGKYIFRQIKMEYKNIQKDDVYDRLKKQSGDLHYQNNYKDVYDALVFEVKNKLTSDELAHGKFMKQFDPANVLKVSE